MIPIHNHSYFSALDGFSTPEEIALRCLEIECPCCGLTDHGVVTGHLAFAKELTKYGIKPMFGCELYHGVDTTASGKDRDQAHLVAIAQNDKGLRNLWSLVSATADNNHFHYVGRVFWDELEKYSEGLIVTSACMAGLVSKGIQNDDRNDLNRYLDIFGDNFYIEISTYPSEQQEQINHGLVEIAQERGIPMVYANDAHYAFPYQFEAHDMYLAIQTGQSVYTPLDERKMYHPPEAVSMMDEETVRDHLSYLYESIVDECIANSDAIAQMVSAELPEVRRHLPVFVPGDCPWLNEDDKSLSPEELFVNLVEAGIVNRYGEDASEEVWDRALYEMETLLNDGIHHYFLMGWDEVQFAHSDNFDIGPGRGSSAGCIVAYALGITDVDPLHFGLIFERFWNSGRAKGFPDIDSDFPRKKRAGTIEYLKKRWGQDRVYPIGTTTYMKPKSVVDKVARGFEVTFDEATNLKAIVGQTTKIEIVGHEQVGWSRDYEPGKLYYVDEDCGKEIAEWIKAGKDRAKLREEFVEMCRMCCSRVSQYGIHASGVVISDVPLTDELPVYARGNKDDRQAVTMFAMKDVDNRQFVKLDILGLRTLDVLDNWRLSMQEKGVDLTWSGIELDEHPQEMWEMLHNGYTAGVFQVEDGYGRQLCKSMMPVSINDLSVINALNRPGPIQAKIPDEYIARRNGEKDVTYPHPSLETIQAPILGETHGLFVYQEQIIQFFTAIGYSMSESDAVRKILGKKNRQDFADLKNGEGEWEGKGYFEKIEALGVPHDIAEAEWDKIEGFSDYCFNKSHTVAYGVLTLRTLFAKYYAPTDFYVACMNSFDPGAGDRIKKVDMAPQYVNEARRLGIDVRPPDIEKSRSSSYADEDGTWWFGFEDIKGVGVAGQYLVYLRDEIGLDISSFEAFQESFNSFNTAFLDEQKRIKKEGGVTEKVKSPKQQLRANNIQSLDDMDCWRNLSPSGRTLSERQKQEQELLGVILTDNSAEVIEKNQGKIDKCDDFTLASMPWVSEDEEIAFVEYTVAGIVTGIVEKRSRKGNTFGIITISDIKSDRQIEFTVFGNKYKNSRFLFRLRTVGIYTLQHNPPNDYGENYIFEKGTKLS